jgi:Tfp pilus assembly protein PilO
MTLSTAQVTAFLRKFPLAISCGALCLAMVGWSFYRSDAVPSAERTLEDKKSMADRLEANLRNASQLREQADAVTAASKQIQARLIQPAELDTNLQFFLRIEAETGTKITQLQQNVLPPPPKDKKPTYIAVPYNVSVQGDFPRLVAFLRKVEHGSHFCRINGSTINAPLIIAASSANAGDEGVSRADPALTLTLSLDLLGIPAGT